MSDFNSSLPVRSESNGDVVVRLVDGSVTSQFLAIDASGRATVKLTDGAGNALDSTTGALHVLFQNASMAVTATDLDIRDLAFATDSVDVSGSEVTVEATDLDIRDLAFATDSVDVSGSDITATVSATDLDIRDLAFATDSVDVSGSSVTVSATDLDIRDLSSATDSVEVVQSTHDDLNTNANLQVGDVDVGPANPVPVYITEDAATEVYDFDQAAEVAGADTSTHDYVFVSAGKLAQVFAAASGKLRIQVQIETAASSDTFNTVAVGFNSTAAPNIYMTFAKPIDVPAGAIVRVIRRNGENQAQDLYSTIIGALL